MKWGLQKQAWQRAKRLEAKGVRNDALRAYKTAIENIKRNEGGWSREKQTQLREDAARAFLQEKTSSISGIKEKAAAAKKQGKYVEDYLQQLERAKDFQAIADYIDASKNEKDVMLARHYVGSDSIAQVREIQQAHKAPNDMFYKVLHELAKRGSKREMSPDEISGMITELEDRYNKGRI